jgi:hypothetical protein
MKTYEGVDIETSGFLTFTLVGGERSASRTGRFTLGERAYDTFRIGWVNLRAGLDAVEKMQFSILPGLELRPLGRAARNQSLYRMLYSDY